MARLCHRGNGTGNPRQHRDFCRLCGRAWIFRPSCSRVSTDWTALSWLLAGQIPIGIMDIRIRALRCDPSARTHGGRLEEERINVKLHFNPGSCFLSSHAALEEAGPPYWTQMVDLTKKVPFSEEKRKKK